jgi:hypothetical protein
MKSLFLMRRLCWVAMMMVALSGLLVVSGCTVGESMDEVRVRHDRVIYNNLGRIQDDIDTVFLLDQPSRLSDQPVR